MSILSLTLPGSLTADKSVEVLNQIIGVVYNFIDPSSEAVSGTFAQLLRHFNEALLGFGLIIFAIMLFIGTMNTASDGQFLGRNWNSTWTPVRLILGILFVVPLKTGLCIGQYLFLYVILLGVVIATNVWNAIVSDIFTEYSAPAIPTYVSDYAKQLVEKQLLYASIVPVVTKMLNPPQTPKNCTLNPANPDQFFQLWVTNRFYTKAITAYNAQFRSAIGRENILSDILPELSVNPANIPASVIISDTQKTPSYNEIAAAYAAENNGQSLNDAGSIGMSFDNNVAKLIHVGSTDDGGNGDNGGGDQPFPPLENGIDIPVSDINSIYAKIKTSDSTDLGAEGLLYAMASQIYIAIQNPPSHEVDKGNPYCKSLPGGKCTERDVPKLTKMIITKSNGQFSVTVFAENGNKETHANMPLDRLLEVFKLNNGTYWKFSSGSSVFSPNNRLPLALDDAFHKKTITKYLETENTWSISVPLDGTGKATGSLTYYTPSTSGGVQGTYSGGKTQTNTLVRGGTLDNQAFNVGGNPGLGNQIYTTLLAASQAHKNRTLTLKDIDDPCLGADKPQKSSSSSIPTNDKAIEEALTAEYDIDQMYTIGQGNGGIPIEVQTALKNSLEFCENMPRSIDGGSSSTIQSQIYSCKRAMTQALANGGLNGIPQDGYGGFEGTTRIWFGSNIPTMDDIFEANQKAAAEDARTTAIAQAYTEGKNQNEADAAGDAAAAQAIADNPVPYSMSPAYNPWSKPNGQIHITGHYKYSFIPIDNSIKDSTSGDDGALSDADLTNNTALEVQTNLRSAVSNYVDMYITALPDEIPDDKRLGDDDSVYDNLCTNTSAEGKTPAYCSLNTVASGLVAAAQIKEKAELEGLCKGTPTDPRCFAGDSLDAYTIKSIPEYTTEKTFSYIDVHGEKQTKDSKPVYVLDPKTGEPSTVQATNPQGQLLYSKQIDIIVPLKKSWWNAGAAYLIIDNQFSENLKTLIDALKRNAASIAFKEKAEGTTKVDFGIMIEQKMPKALDITSGMAHCYGVLLTSVCTAPGHSSDPNYDTILFRPQEIQLEPHLINPSELKSSGANYYQLITPFDPNLNEGDDPNNTMYKYRVDNSSDSLFYGLSQVPVDLQDPLVRILMVAKAESINNNANCPIGKGGVRTCFQNLTPYLSNMINVMRANLLIGNQSSNLPLNAAMDQMLSKLMGKGEGIIGLSDGKVVDNSSLAQTTSENMTSIMNQIYNFGYTAPDLSGNIAAQNFSMVQNIRVTGISILVACISSMQNVLYHFQASADNLTQSINDIITTGDGAQAKNLAEASKWTYVGATALSGAASGIATIGSMAGITFAGTGNAGLGLSLAKAAELVASGAGLAAQGLSVGAQFYQAKAELAIATETITTMSQLGIQLMWLPLFLFVITSLITIGIQFAFVIPFMPYIMFWGGQMAWVLGVIEALVAAPLVMLAFAHPGGNDYIGHAQPAVRFLLGVTFRPVLMVIGMLTGILLTYVLIHYSAEGFHIIANNTLNTLDLNNIILSGAISCFLVLMYASFLMMAFTKCFSPIYMLPEKVVQWINGQQSISGGEQEAQQFGQQAQQTGQSGGQAAGQSLSQGIDAQKQKGQGSSDVSKQGMSTDVGTNTKVGDSLGKENAGFVKYSRSSNQKQK